MGRGAKAANAKVEARRPVARKSRKIDGSKGRKVDQRLAEALKQHAAISEILNVISASPSDVQPVLDAVAERAARLCEAPFARVLLVDGDVLRTMAQYSLDRRSQARTIPVALGRTSINGRAVVDRATIHHGDVVSLLKSEYPDARQNALRLGFRAVLSVPLMREGNAYGAIFLWRREPGLFSREQVALVQTFAQQAAIAVDNVRLFKATKEALEQQTATSEILRVISRSPNDLQPVFHTILANATRLCEASVATLWLFDGEVLTSVAHQNASPEFADYLARARLRPSNETTTRRAALERRTIHCTDLLSDPNYSPPEFQRKESVRTVLSVPLLCENTLLGVVTLWRREVHPFTENQIALVQTFADQAVIAIENVRLFTELDARNRDLTEALERQTATSGILRVISQSPRDVQPVFDTIAERSATLCGATFAFVTTFDGEWIHMRATHGAGSEEHRANYPIRPGRDSLAARVVHDHMAVQIPDFFDDPDYAHKDAARKMGYRSGFGVPMTREGQTLGVIAITHKEPGVFPDKQIALLQTFADQAVIAIENVRLFKELETRNRDLTEALEQQTATSDILRVISQSPTDVQPVFDTIANAALKLCGARSANVFTYDGDLVRVAAMVILDPAYVEVMRKIYPRPLSRDTAVLRAIQTRSVVAISDVLEDLDYISALGVHSTAGGFRSVLAVPLMREGNAIGGIAVGRAEPGPFPDTQVALLQTFADQAVIAIENVRLFKELETRNRDLTEALEQQTATSEILRAISQSQTDAQPVFETIATATLKLCSASSAIVATFDGELIRLAALANVNPEGTDVIRHSFPRRPSRDSATARSVLTRSVVAIPDVLEDPDYAEWGAALPLGLRSILSVPLIREGGSIGAISVWRTEPGALPDNQIALLQTFADQAVIAIENVRLFTELETRNRDLTEALEQQTATSEILRVISQSQTDAQPVFDTIAAAALKLCSASSAVVTRFDGELIRVAALANVSPEGADAVRSRYPRSPGRYNAASRAVLTRSVVVIPDVLEDPEYEIRGPLITAGFRSVVAVPLMREGNPMGAITVVRPEPGPFPDKQVTLLQTFADQAVIAIENVRLFNELETRNRDLTEALEQQTATSDILRVISQSPTNVQPVFDTIAVAAMTLCRASSATVARFDGELLHLAAIASVNPEGADAVRRIYPRPPSREITSSRAVLTRSVVAIPDVLEDPDFAHKAAAIAGGFRSTLAVPLMRERIPIGAITVGRPVAGPFPEKQIALLKTFADQAVIAIENVRLFNETKEALEHQKASAEVLGVISSSMADAKPVFDKILESCERLFEGHHVGMSLLGEDNLVHLGGYRGPGGEAFAKTFPYRLGRDSATGTSILERRLIHFANVQTDDGVPERMRAAGPLTNTKSQVLAPMISKDRPIGAIFVGRPIVRPFSEKEIALLRTFADQAVIAIENVRLFKELESRTNELTRSVGELKALGEVGQAVSSTLDLETVLRTIVSRATTLAGVEGGAIYEYDETTEEFYLRAVDRYADDLVEVLRSRRIRKGEGAVGRLAVVLEPVQVRDITDESIYQSGVREILIRLGYRSLLAVPLLREDHLLGGLVVNRKSAGEFAPQVIDLMKTFATQSALAIQNARLFREIEEKSRELETASRHKSEFLANMSHELRTPLNAIIGFSEVLSERMFGEINQKQAEYLSDILESGRHLLSLINDILDLSKIEAGRMELEATDFDLPTAIENTLILVRERAQRRGITLGRTVDERLGMIRADERKLKQVLLNLLSNALKFTPEGGQIDVRARAHNGEAEISVADTGVGIAPEDQEAVFEEFRQVGTAAKKGEGTGLGLAISRKFIELHGGRIWVKSQVGIGSTFAFTLPLTP